MVCKVAEQHKLVGNILVMSVSLLANKNSWIGKDLTEASLVSASRGQASTSASASKGQASASASRGQASASASDRPASLTSLVFSKCGCAA